MQARDLPSLITSAIQSHPRIRAAKAKLDIAKQNRKSAGWQFYPTPSVQAQMATATGNNPNFQGDAMVFTVGLEQPVWQGGKRFAEYGKAKIDINIARARMLEQQYQIAFELIDAYGKWMAAHLKLSAYENSLKEHGRLLNRVENRANVGVSNRGDIDLALSRLEATKSEYLNARFEESSSLSLIIEIINEPVEASELAASLPGPTLQEEAFDVLLERALSTHPAILIKQHESQKARKNITSTKANLWPDVYLKLEQQIGHFAVEDADPSTTFLIGVRSQFGAGLSAFSEIKASSANLKATQMDIETQQRQLKQQIVESHILVNSYLARKKAAEITLNAAEKVYDSYSRQFLAARKSWLDLMNSLREKTSNHLELADLTAALMVVSKRYDININGLSGYISDSSQAVDIRKQPSAPRQESFSQDDYYIPVQETYEQAPPNMQTPQAPDQPYYNPNEPQEPQAPYPTQQGLEPWYDPQPYPPYTYPPTGSPGWRE